MCSSDLMIYLLKMGAKIAPAFDWAPPERYTMVVITDIVPVASVSTAATVGAVFIYYFSSIICTKR